MRQQHGRKDSPRFALRTLREEIKKRIDYHQFFLRYCPEAQVTGARLKARCPIPAHQHTGSGKESLSVDLQRGLYHCFSRGDGGDAIRFYEQMHGVAFAQAVALMAAELNIEPTEVPAPIPTEHITAVETSVIGADELSAVCAAFLEVCGIEDQSEGVNYLLRRGIGAEVINKLGVTYFPRASYHRVMRKMLQAFDPKLLQESGLFNQERHLTFYRHRLLFPFYVENCPVYLQARTTATGVEPRWHNLRGAVPVLYNVDCLAELRSGETVYLVEGFTDTLTLLTHGFNAVGIVGAGGLKKEWVPLLARFKILVALDGDQAGMLAAAKYQQLFATNHLHAAQVILPTDVNDFFKTRPSAALEITLLAESALERSRPRGG